MELNANVEVIAEFLAVVFLFLLGIMLLAYLSKGLYVLDVRAKSLEVRLFSGATDPKSVFLTSQVDAVKKYVDETSDPAVAQFIGLIRQILPQTRKYIKPQQVVEAAQTALAVVRGYIDGVPGNVAADKIFNPQQLDENQRLAQFVAASDAAIREANLAGGLPVRGPQGG